MSRLIQFETDKDGSWKMTEVITDLVGAMPDILKHKELHLLCNDKTQSIDYIIILPDAKRSYTMRLWKRIINILRGQ